MATGSSDGLQPSDPMGLNMNREMYLHKEMVNDTPLPSLLFLLSFRMFWLSFRMFWSILSDVWIRPRCLLSFIDHLFSSPGLIPKGPTKAELCIKGGQAPKVCILTGTWLQRVLCCVGLVRFFKAELGKYCPSKFLLFFVKLFFYLLFFKLFFFWAGNFLVFTENF